MTKQELQEQTNQILRELRDLHNQLDILQDDVEIEAEGCTDEESEKRQDFKDMAGQSLNPYCVGTYILSDGKVTGNVRGLKS